MENQNETDVDTSLIKYMIDPSEIKVENDSSEYNMNSLITDESSVSAVDGILLVVEGSELSWEQQQIRTDKTVDFQNNNDKTVKNARGRRKKRSKIMKVSSSVQRRKSDIRHGGFACALCSFVGTTPIKLERHMQRFHSVARSHNCPVCEFSGETVKDYEDHLSIHFPGPPFRCDIATCDFTSPAMQELLSHRTTHKGSIPWLCSECGLQCRCRSALITHQRTHTGEKPYCCPKCNKCFCTKGLLDQHIVTHNKERQFLCDQCGFTTKHQSHFFYHMRIHSGDVYRCQIKNCTYVTPKSGQLQSHIRSHLKLRCHECATCGASFVERSHLLRHERTHLAEKPFSCNVCGYSTTRKDKLSEHSIKYHCASPESIVPAMYRQRKQKSSNFGVKKKIEPDAAMQQLHILMDRAERQRQGLTGDAANEQGGQEFTEVIKAELDESGDFDSSLNDTDGDDGVWDMKHQSVSQ